MVQYFKTHRLLVVAILSAVGTASPSMADDASRANIVITTSGGDSAAATPGRSQAGATYRVTARVPLACWVRLENPLIAQEGASGAVTEACNNPGGFMVMAAYRPLKAQESARMIYDDQTLDLAKSGTQLLRRSSIATIKRVAYRIASAQLDEPLTLSLTIQPI